MTSAKSTIHVLIIGAGMSGLTLAHQLQKQNISYTVFERDVDNDARSQGWALSLFGDALKLIEERMPAELGPVEQASHLKPLKLPAQFSFYDITRPGFRVGVVSDESGRILRCNRQKLRDWLLQGLNVRFNKRVIRVEEESNGVRAHFQDGTSASGDFLVGAEGTRSLIRKHLLNGKDVMRPLPVGCMVGEVALSGEDFLHQLTLAHSGYVVMDSTLRSDQQKAIFSALNRVSDDGTTGYYYFLLLWVDQDAPSLPEKGLLPWTESATKEELAAFAREKTKDYPDELRALVDKVPTEGYKSHGFHLQGVELEAEQLPSGRVLLIGDAAHSMTPFRGEAGVCAFTDAFKLGDLFSRVQETRARDDVLQELVSDFNKDMISRGRWASKVSNSVLEDYGKEPEYEFGTFGKNAGPMAREKMTMSALLHHDAKSNEAY